MEVSKHAQELRKMIEKAIEDHIITRAEFDAIMTIVLEDGHIDKQEQALLHQLQDMIEDKSVKIIP
jgi:cAMP phosphodiesterase